MLKKFRIRCLACFLAFNLAFGGGSVVPQSTKAGGPAGTTVSAVQDLTKTAAETGGELSKPAIGAKAGIGMGILVSVLGSVIASMIPRVLAEIVIAVDTAIDKAKERNEIAKYSGFRTTPEIIKGLEAICDGTSEVRVYGQKRAKKQMFDALSSVAARVDDLKRGKCDKKDMRGNIVYLIGPSGTGKTKMCYAIADAFLRHPEKTCIFCHSESITSESELGTQLFKTILTKDIGKKRKKNWFTGSDGLVPKDEESPMLKHLLQWYESVVIIDEYDKMKQKSAKPGTTMTFQGITMPVPGEAATSSVDNSADEIFRSIASTGQYKFMNKEVDCSKTLFLVTTNETREELETNFGIQGTKGGGAQRLSIVEFDYLSKEACRSIVDDMLKNLSESLTNPEGPYRLSDAVFDERSRDLMAECMFCDKVTQGRVKNKLEDEIRGLMARYMGKDYGKKVKIVFTKNAETGEYEFSRELAN